MKSIWSGMGKAMLVLLMMMFAFSVPTFAHCDSYDGPVVQDALKALNEKDVRCVMKWIEKDQEAEISALFEKTVAMKDADGEIYAIVKKHFLETLVRLHREMEGAPFTGLKAAGSTAPIIQMADQSIANGNANTLLGNLNKHIERVISEKYEKVNRLSRLKDQSTADGRAYVEAYVDYTHTLEAIEGALDHGGH